MNEAKSYSRYVFGQGNFAIKWIKTLDKLGKKA